MAIPAIWRRREHWMPCSIRLNQPVDEALQIDVDVEMVIARIAKRAAEEGRSDDTEEVVRNRMKVYSEQTAPVVDYYAQKGLLSRVSGRREHRRSVPAPQGCPADAAQHPDGTSCGYEGPVTGQMILKLLDMLRLRSGPQDMPSGWPVGGGHVFRLHRPGLYCRPYTRRYRWRPTQLCWQSVCSLR